MPDRKDPQKDAIRTDSSSEAIVKDNVHKTDIGLFLDQTLRTNPFGHNLSGEHVYRRAERAAAALHLVTNHIAADEPVRGLVRKESITLLHLSLGLRSELRAHGSELFKRTRASIRKLISLVRLLGVSGFASVQNTQILVDALDELGNALLTAERSVLAEETPLSREDLMPRRLESVRESAAPARANVSREPRTVGGRSILKDRTVMDAGVNTSQQSMRSERILDILRSGGTLGIKDITANLPEYSEKMVQRELALLSSIGKVTKTGAKRWSKYSYR